MLTATVSAQGYLGFSFGKANYPNACAGAAAGITCEGSDAAVKLLAGYQFTPNFALEFAYGDLGRVSASTGEAADLAAADWTAIGTWPLGNGFAVHGRFGGYYGSLSGNSTTVAVDNTTPCPGAPPGFPPPPPCHAAPPPLERGWQAGTTTDFTFGLGASYEMAHNTFARLEWQRYKNLGGSGGPKVDVDLFSFGAVVRFQ